ncbi:MAG: copper-binding protein [Polyangiaceae bacterium]|nr:copper-binding protein [Polyangiaceae bacterium]
MLVDSAKRSTSLVLAIATILLVVPAPACSRSQDQPSAARTAPSSAPSQTYSTRGKVRAIGERKDNITIAHEEIPNYMKAMTMMFEVERPEILNDVKVDDQISFTFSDRDGRLYVESITKTK